MTFVLKRKKEVGGDWTAAASRRTETRSRDETKKTAEVCNVGLQ